MDELAREVGCDADALRCLLRALCVLQVCSVRRDSRFGLGASGDWLRCEPPAGAPGFRDMVRWWAGSMERVTDFRPLRR